MNTNLIRNFENKKDFVNKSVDKSKNYLKSKNLDYKSKSMQKDKLFLLNKNNNIKYKKNDQNKNLIEDNCIFF